MRKVIFCLAAVLLLLCACTDAPDEMFDPPSMNTPIGSPQIGERSGSENPNSKTMPYLAEDLYRLN